METKNRVLLSLDILTLCLLTLATVMVFFYAPVEAVMGLVQKVFYFHVAAGWVGMLGFLVATIAGILYLINRNQRWDIIGLASIEIGMVFAFINIVTGSIWARPIWNTWWTWDPRLTTATIMVLIYAAYFMLRGSIEDPSRRARFAAVYAILGFVSVPLTFLSARLFRTIHPIVIGANQAGTTGAFDMTPKMLTTFLFSLFVFSIIFIDLLWHRVRMGEIAEQVDELRQRLSD